MRKILYISGTRADYGLMRHTLFCINAHPKLRLEVAVTGMHLMAEFGRTIDEIEKDKFKINVIRAICADDTKESEVRFISKLILLLGEKIKTIKPDMFLILGDRAEMLASAITGVYLGIPVAHIHGGDLSYTVDEISRHAITKLSHLHFAATSKSAERIIKMGEEPWRVHRVGAPGLDDILSERLYSKQEIADRYNLDLSKPSLLVVQHPVTTEIDRAAKQMGETMEAISRLGIQSIVVYPNSDPGSWDIIKAINKYRNLPFIRIHKNISRKEYLSLMAVVSAIVGNSSSAIIEAPSFSLPAINIGTRQEGRQSASNVICSGYKREEIKKAIKQAVYSKEFKKSIQGRGNPYGNGKAGEKIAAYLNATAINSKLLQKRSTYQNEKPI